MRRTPARRASGFLNRVGSPLACRFGLPLAYAVAAIGCSVDEPTAHIEYRHGGGTDSATLEVYLHAGLDRDWDPEFKPGEIGQARLRHYWNGPEVPSDKSYRLRLDLYPDGRVDSEHCVMPCSLPER